MRMGARRYPWKPSFHLPEPLSSVASLATGVVTSLPSWAWLALTPSVENSSRRLGGAAGVSGAAATGGAAAGGDAVGATRGGAVAVAAAEGALGAGAAALAEPAGAGGFSPGCAAAGIVRERHTAKQGRDCRFMGRTFSTTRSPRSDI